MSGVNMKPRLPQPRPEHLLSTLQRVGNQDRAAEHYGCHRSTIQQWMSDSKITAKDYRTGHASYKKLEADDIPMIRELYAAGMTKGAIARKFDVVRNCIDNIIRGNTWGWVK